MHPRPRTARKILVASIGVATMTYVAASCGGSTQSPVGNLAAPDTGPADGEAGITFDESPVANLVAIPFDTGRPDTTAGADVGSDAVGDTSEESSRDALIDTIDEFPVANLVVRPDTGIH